MAGAAIRRASLPLLSALFAAACGAAPPGHPQPEVVVAVPATPSAAPDPEPPEDAKPPAPATVAGPPELKLPSPAACVLETARWRGAQPVTELRMGIDGPVFAHITIPRARLHLPIGTAAAGAGIEVEDVGLALRGIIEGNAFTLRPAKPVVLGGFVVPSSFANLVWAESRDREVSITYDVGTGVEPIQAPLSAKLPCDAVTAEFAQFEPEDAVGDMKNAKDGLLRTGRAIDLAIEPGGPVVARLRAKDDQDGAVKVIGVSGASKRILWWRDTALVFGWVASADVRTPQKLVGYGYGIGRGGGVLGKSFRVIDVVRCDQDVTVIADAEGQRATVGSIRAGTTIEILSRENDYVSVQTRSRTIAASRDVFLLVRAQQMKDCRKE